jgi:hypothetical protein
LRALDAARAEVGDVHGLVLPECALSYDVFRHLCEKLESRPGFELFIAGLFDAKEPDQGYRKGNFAAMARREKGADGNFRFDISTALPARWPEPNIAEQLRGEQRIAPALPIL